MNENLQKNLSSAALVLINCLFVFKYSSRVSVAMAIGATLLLAVVSVFFLRRFLLVERPFMSSRFALGVGVVYVTAMALMLPAVDPEMLAIDRWEMIQLFFRSVENNRYPYSVASGVDGNYPGGMPFYFLLCYPFYKLGDVGWMPLLLLFVLLLYFFFKPTKGYANGVVWILSMAFVGYEVVARSTVLVNACLWMFYLWLLLQKNDFSKQGWWLAVLGGVLLSTRIVFVLVLVVYGLFSLRQGTSFGRLIVWGGVVLLAFAATFVPLVVKWGVAAFVGMNPFLIQSIFLPSWGVMGVFLVALLLGWGCRSSNDVIFSSGSILFAVIAFYFVYVGWENGFEGALLGSEADITYFLFSVPFFVFRTIRTNDFSVNQYN